jgi:hypothetical protein
MTHSEKAVAQFCRKSGYEVYRNGWPDFLLHHAERSVGFALEVKSRCDRLRPCQSRMIEALDRMGVITHTRYTGEVEGFLDDEPIAMPALGRTPYRSLGLHCERVMRRLDALEKKCSFLVNWQDAALRDFRKDLCDLRKTFDRLENIHRTDRAGNIVRADELPTDDPLAITQ